MPSCSLSYLPHEKGHLPRSQVAVELVGVAGFEPAASSSRTSSSAGTLATVPASGVCYCMCEPVAVRGRCCTSLLYSGRTEPSAGLGKQSRFRG